MVIETEPETGLTEEALLAQAQAGDAEAFCALAARYEQRLLRQACGLARNQFTAEDLVCETLAEAWRGLGRYNHTCRFSTWLFAILLHRFQKHLRAQRSRPISLASLSDPAAEAHREFHESLPAPGPSPADTALERETAEQVRAALESLPDKHRRVLLLRFFEGASLAEIASLLGCSVGTVKSRLHYALEKLRGTSVGQRPV